MSNGGGEVVLGTFSELGDPKLEMNTSNLQVLIDRAVEIRLVLGSLGGVTTARGDCTIGDQAQCPFYLYPTSGINPSEYAWNYPKPSPPKPKYNFRVPPPRFV